MKRSRGRGRRPQNNNNNNNNNSHHHNHNRAFDSTGPDVKIRGTAAHVYEKYLQLARDAGSAGDRVMQENYLQHAEHYYRILMAQGGQLGLFGFWSMIVFLGVLTIGFIYEWKKGALEWE